MGMLDKASHTQNKADVNPGIVCVSQQQRRPLRPNKKSQVRTYKAAARARRLLRHARGLALLRLAELLHTILLVLHIRQAIHTAGGQHQRLHGYEAVAFPWLPKA
jgi:hypothetical protein